MKNCKILTCKPIQKRSPTLGKSSGPIYSSALRNDCVNSTISTIEKRGNNSCLVTRPIPAPQSNAYAVVDGPNSSRNISESAISGTFNEV
uniref:Uncharacterized protein n=1 Tax=Schistosoma curassoni TaxID=6186 RepID=A0A183KA03_9TREM